MDWKVIANLVRPELLIVCAFLYCVGAFLKLLPHFADEWAIPYVLLAASLIVTPLYMAFVLHIQWSAEMAVSGLIQAVLIAALTVFANQLAVQITRKRAIDTQQAPTDITFGK